MCHGPKRFYIEVIHIIGTEYIEPAQLFNLAIYKSASAVLPACHCCISNVLRGLEHPYFFVFVSLFHLNYISACKFVYIEQAALVECVCYKEMFVKMIQNISCPD